MKKSTILLYSIAIFTALPFIATSQANRQSFSSLLAKYYDVKNALVNSDANTASKSATGFSEQLKSIDIKNLPSNGQEVFNRTKGSLLKDANTIATGNDLSKQRFAFQSLSANLITLVKTFKPIAPVYIVFCPMKKASWLSAENGVKNPYYGSSMLTCGQITDTLK